MSATTHAVAVSRALTRVVQWEECDSVTDIEILSLVSTLALDPNEATRQIAERVRFLSTLGKLVRKQSANRSPRKQLLLADANTPSRPRVSKQVRASRG